MEFREKNQSQEGGTCRRLYGCCAGEGQYEEVLRKHSDGARHLYYSGIMIGGAMIFNYDFHGADIIALLFAFMVLYSGVVAVLTDK